ncbi:cupin domain-containing protein [Ketobacter sp.]|uniref:cupin domain-containing protein n=1 Tax=Ketobacter sp. TaxID=2083498 RepID=UPI000F230A10|nr:cupin domain-containing protein [Ketobacter sp.]RLT97359.1 MAG: cupin domain-containing protein [Ketobacter sp.]
MASKPLAILGGRSAELFLSEYWQKHPMLVRGAFPNIEHLLEADELAGLSLDDTVESRIILERSPVDWELRHGPFNNKTFKNLPKTHWTLLVQAVDHQVPAVADLLSAFDFIPNWRIDDIMASFAPQGGSVGPHYDYYDVFLIQTQGQRRWRLGQMCDEHSALIPNLPVRILKDFHPQQEWVLNPGDMLYLPPGLAHYGVAENECITLSVGFRAPSEQEIIGEFVHFLMANSNEGQRYTDPDLTLQSNPGWLAPSAVEKVAATLQRLISDREQITHWMGEYLSQTKYDQNPEPPEEDYHASEVLELLHQKLSVCREESSRFIFTGDQNHPTALFINGTKLEFHPFTQQLILFLCKSRHYDPTKLAMFCEAPVNLRFLTQLLNMGVLYFEEEPYHD